MSAEQFTGFGKPTRAFLADLSRNNNKPWFTEHRTRYEDDLLSPATGFVLELGPRLKKIYPHINYGTQKNGTGSIMRIYRDVRFSKDKRPYKENLGVIFWIGEGKKVELPCFYFHLDAGKSFFYGGRHMFPKDVLETYRSAVADDASGTELEEILSSLEKQGLPLMEEPAYKRVPRGYPADHPRELLLRLGGLGVSMDITPEAAAAPDLVESCAGAAAKMKPLLDWLEKIGG